MEKLNWKKILLLCLPMVFAVSLAITLAACMAQAGRGVGDSLFGDGDVTTVPSLPVISDKPEAYSDGLTYMSRGDGTCVLTGLGICRDVELRIPEKSPSGDTVVSIGTSAFLGNTTVKRVIFPETLTTIGDYAFYGSSLTYVEITSCVKSVGEGAFSSCESLETISVDGENKYYASIDGVLFSKDKSTLICYPSGRKNTSYTIRFGVGTIASAAFLNCVYLEKVNYNGKAAEWADVKIGANNGSLTSLKINFLTSAK